jgi:peroxiredoxin
MLQRGDQAPDFELPTADMSMLRCSDYQDKKNLVIYFYPKDDTPGCTMEAIEFSELMDAFAKLDTVILGISSDTCVSHGNFRDKYGLTIELLADVDKEACEAFGVMQTKSRNGVERRGIQRSTFVVDKQGIIQHALYGVTPGEHAKEILERVEKL